MADVREQFAREGQPQKARTRAFIEGKIEMIRRDPQMTEAETVAAIAELAAKR
jgi:histidyl-tRNA synthetase